MLRELKNTRQIPGESRRRWFTSVDMDLIVWFDTDDNPTDFELCYDKRFNEKSLRFSPSGVAHSAVDAGENNPGKYKSTPVLRETRHFDTERLQSLFSAEGTELPAEIENFVIASFKNYTATRGSEVKPVS